jgi:hypothetical protein
VGQSAAGVRVAVQRALDDGPGATAAQGSAQGASASPPNQGQLVLSPDKLTDLADEVFARLRWRLAAERERSFG